MVAKADVLRRAVELYEYVELQLRGNGRSLVIDADELATKSAERVRRNRDTNRANVNRE